MRVVNVAHLETSTLTRKTTRTESRKAALVRYLGKGVGLVHELREGVGAEERVYNARNGFGVNQVGGCEHLVVAYVHTFANGAAHTGQSDRELVSQLFAHGAHAAVAQVVDVVNGSVRVNQLNEILDNLDNIVFG